MYFLHKNAKVRRVGGADTREFINIQLMDANGAFVLYLRNMYIYCCVYVTHVYRGFGDGSSSFQGIGYGATLDDPWPPEKGDLLDPKLPI